VRPNAPPRARRATFSLRTLEEYTNELLRYAAARRQTAAATMMDNLPYLCRGDGLKGYPVLPFCLGHEE